MIKRRKTKIVNVANLKIGCNFPVLIQSMTKVYTTDVDKCVKQVKQLLNAGCHLVRIAVPAKADTEAFKKIVDKVKAPLIADIHFSPERAIEAIEAGAAKIRLNPGNIKNKKDLIKIIHAAKTHKTAIRIGVNEASIRDLKHDTPLQKRTVLMIKEMRKYVAVFEKENFSQIVLSAKSSDPLRTIQVNRKIAQTFPYPIHLGLTHAGLVEDALVPSAVAMGTLLAEGIGDTIRISVAGNPVKEVQIAKQILTSVGIYPRTTPELIVCPTCGRTQSNLVKLARSVKKALTQIEKPLRIAVMGCVVNGPGEAADADLAVCAAKNKAYLYKNGEKIAIVPIQKIESEIIKQLKKL